MAKTQIVFIHGISDQKTGYSDGLFNKILSFYKEGLARKKVIKSGILQRVEGLVQNEILWADLTKGLLNEYLKYQYKLKERPGIWDNFIMQPIDPLVLQILYYVKDKGTKKDNTMRVLKRVEDTFKDKVFLRPNKTVIVAHSLGSVIAFDYVFGFRKKYKLSSSIDVTGLLTMGSPIPLFTAAMGHVTSDVKLPKNVREWVNVFDHDDGVARYCAPCFKNTGVKDVDINTSIFPLKAHTHYWYSDDIAEFIANKLIEWDV